jgi:ribosomal protein S4
MSYVVKNRNRFIKQTCLDLWGTYISYKKLNRTLNVLRFFDNQEVERKKFFKKDFIFSLRKRINFIKKKKFKPNFINRRILCNFYLVLTLRHFRNLANKAKKLQGYYVENYFNLIEGRIFMVCYRTNLITNLFLIRHVIREGMFTVNFRVKRHYNILVKRSDFFSVSKT